MESRAAHCNRKPLVRYSFENLLAWLLLYMLAGPFLKPIPHVRFVLSAILTFALASAIVTVTCRSRLFFLTIVLLLWTLVMHWLTVFDVVALPPYLPPVAMALYLATLIFSFAGYIFRARTIDSSLISGALCLYLLLGMLWGSIYALLEALQPGSFAGDLLARAVDPASRLQQFQYFSFVTLTTLGYGDILPRTEGATALCQTEAIIGQFFMAVLVARLVGIRVAQEFSGNSGDGG